MSLPASGATMARVTPRLRVIASAETAALTAGATSMAAENGDWLATLSLASPTPSTSVRPRLVQPATRPGVTQRPWASMRWASPGTATPAPAATMRPFG